MAQQQQDRESKHRLRPYYASSEVMEIAGVSRRLLTSVTERGICVPYRDEDTGALGWTLGQIDVIVGVGKLRELGMGFDEIAELFDRGPAAFERAVCEAHMQLGRAERRSTKRTALRHEMAKQSARVGERRGYYLRYLPQRWMAIIPQPGNKISQPNAHAKACIMLSDVVTHVGWAPAGIGGVILGAPTPTESPRFAFIDLASQPMPAPSASGVLDGGCYRHFGGRCGYGRDEGECGLCPHFGSPVTNSDELRWETYSNANAYDNCTVLASDLERPYPCGPWCEATVQAAGEADRLPGKAAKPPTAAARPRIMPQEVPLPLGVTACVMPAGTYLCRQCKVSDFEQVVSELVGTARVIPHRDLTVDREIERARSLELTLDGDLALRDGFGKQDEMMTGPDLIGDPAQMGWWRELEDRELSRLVIPTSTGIEESSDFSVVCANIPGPSYDELNRIELQVLVETDMLDEPDARRSVGITPPAINRVMSTEKPRMMKCRMCGQHMEMPASGVAVCPRCGRARGSTRIENPATVQKLLDADELRLSGRFEQAQRLVSFVSKDYPEDADTHWLAVLCRYGVTYAEDPGTGRRVPRISLPGERPVREDADAEKALELADDVQWPVYKSQLVQLEMARMAELAASEELANLTARIKTHVREPGREQVADDADEHDGGGRHSSIVEDIMKRLKK